MSDNFNTDELEAPEWMNKAFFEGVLKKCENDKSILVDFQLCYFGPAILDIIYGMYMLFNEDGRKNHLDELVYYYSLDFIKTLEKFKFQGEIPKISDFFIEILRHRHFEIILVSTFLPVWYGFEKGVLDPKEHITPDDDDDNSVYNNEVYIKEIKRLLPIMLNRGYFD